MAEENMDHMTWPALRGRPCWKVPICSNYGNSYECSRSNEIKRNGFWACTVPRYSRSGSHRLSHASWVVVCWLNVLRPISIPFLSRMFLTSFYPTTDVMTHIYLDKGWIAKKVSSLKLFQTGPISGVGSALLCFSLTYILYTLTFSLFSIADVFNQGNRKATQHATNFFEGP